MAANLHLVIIAVLTLFGVFAATMVYAQWRTWGIEVYRAKK